MLMDMAIVLSYLYVIILSCRDNFIMAAEFFELGVVYLVFD